jgi:VanZ family protein
VLSDKKWLLLLLAALGGVIVFSTLAPKGWPVRLGLHWLVEHFLAFFTLTVLACLAFPRPMVVAVVFLPLAVGLEAAQALTPDRTADLATALIAAAAVASGALLADGLFTVRKRRGKA